MLGVLHLYPVRGNFQTQRCLEPLLKNLSGEFSTAAYSLGLGGNFRNLPEALFRLRCARHDQSHVAHAWGPAELMAAAGAGFSRIVFSPQERIHSSWWKWIELVVRKHPVEIICPTNFVRNMFISRGADAGRCHVIAPPVDASRLKVAGSEIRARLGLSDTDLVVLAPGESYREAFHRSAVWATAILNVLDARYRVLIWGRGPMIESLDRFARATEFNRTFINAEKTLGAEIDFEELVPAADFALFFGKAGSPILPLEICVAAGLPIVAAETAETREFLQDGVNAMIEPSVNPRRLAQRVLTLQNDLPLRKRLAETARAVGASRFSVARFLADWRGVYGRFNGSDPSVSSVEAPISSQSG